MTHASPPQQSRPDLTTYAGQWVAIVRGQVYAVADTAVAALHLAQSQRMKDEPEIVWVPLEEKARRKMENGMRR